MVGLSYTMLVLGLMLSMTKRKKLQQIINPSYFTIVCLLASTASFLITFMALSLSPRYSAKSSAFIASGNRSHSQKFTKR